MRLVLPAALALLLLATVSMPLGAVRQAAQPAIVSTEFIYEPGPYPQVHASTLVETTS